MQQQPKPTSSIKLGSPCSKISKDRFQHLVQNQRLMLAQTRKKKGPAVPQVQMSIRMPEADYFKFRALCTASRRTNGEMLLHLLEAYLCESSAGSGN